MSLDGDETRSLAGGRRNGDPCDAALALTTHADEASAFLKALSHSGRLMILGHLAGGEKSVTELEALLGQRQAAVSQQLARLRLEGMVHARRDGKLIFYRLKDGRVQALLPSLARLFQPEG
jgi:DNA-binding transcriptional ArsR family regulator